MHIWTNVCINMCMCVCERTLLYLLSASNHLLHSHQTFANIHKLAFQNSEMLVSTWMGQRKELILATATSRYACHLGGTLLAEGGGQLYNIPVQ